MLVRFLHYKVITCYNRHSSGIQATQITWCENLYLKLHDAKIYTFPIFIVLEKRSTTRVADKLLWYYWQFRVNCYNCYLTYGTHCSYQAYFCCWEAIVLRLICRSLHWLPYSWNTLYLPSTHCPCDFLTYGTPCTYPAYTVLLECSTALMANMLLWYYWPLRADCHIRYLYYGTPCTYPAHIVLLECSTARLVDRLWWYFRLIHVGCYIDTWMLSPFYADSHRIYTRSVNWVLHRCSLQYKCFKLYCGLYIQSLVWLIVFGSKTTITSSELSCLISFSWNPLSCSEQAGIEIFKMKIYVSRYQVGHL